ncbi:MAG TPA: hypothetical protein VE861_01510 [Gemmatimonadaceae bacterium]|nr:hypothetical protein [Gemmatimonadaceae bacterium]
MLAAVMLCAMQGGCYAYRAVPPGDLAAGGDVRLRLTPDGTEALAPQAGLRLRSMNGRLQEVRTDGALLVMPGAVTTVDGDSLTWRRGVLTIPSQALEGSERRTLDRRRTFRFAGVIAGAFAGAVYFTLRSIRGGGGASQGSGPGTPE